MFQSLRNGFQKLCTAVMAVGAAFIVLQMLYGFLNVTGRYLFNKPLPGVVEFTGEAMVYIVFLSAAYIQIKDSHIRIDILFDYISWRKRAVLNIFALGLGATFFGILVWLSIKPTLYSFKIREVSWGSVPFPIYPQRFIVIVGALLLTIQLLFDIVEEFNKLIHGKDIEKTSISIETNKD